MEGLFGFRLGAIQNLLHELGQKKQRLNLDLLGIRRKADDFDHKAVEITDLEERLRKTEEILGDLLDAVEEKDRVVEAKLELAKEKVEFIKTEEKRLDLEKQEISSDRESLLALKEELERTMDEIRQKHLQIDDENKKLQLQQELLLKEGDDLKQLRKQLEQEREALDEMKVVAPASDRKSSDQSGGRCRRHGSWLRNCTPKIFKFSRNASKNLPESSLSDEKATRKRARDDDQTPIEAEAEGRKRRQTDTPLEDPGQQSTPNEQFDTEWIKASEYVLDGNDSGDQSGDNFEQLIKASSGDRSDGINGDGDVANNGNMDEEEEEEEGDDDSEHLGKTSVSRKIWNFLTT